MAKSQEKESSAISVVSESNQADSKSETAISNDEQTGGESNSGHRKDASLLEANVPAPLPGVVSENGAEDPQTAPLYRGTTQSQEMDNELIAINVLLLCALAGGMFYIGTTYFARDSLIFFAGVFIFLFVQPGNFIKGRNKFTRFTKEVALAFVVSFGTFVLLRAVLPPDADQAKLLTLILFVLGAKLVFFPYYNFKGED